MIISENGKFAFFFKYLDIMFCILSSYIYLWYATFGPAEEKYYWIEIFFESFFFVSMIVSFLTDFKHEGEIESEKRLSVIVKRYGFSYQFIYDFIALIPIAIIFRDKGKYIKIFYCLKIFRMIKGLNFFNVKLIFESIKN